MDGTLATLDQISVLRVTEARFATVELQPGREISEQAQGRWVALEVPV